MLDFTVILHIVMHVRCSCMYIYTMLFYMLIILDKITVKVIVSLFLSLCLYLSMCLCLSVSLFLVTNSATYIAIAILLDIMLTL